MTRLFRCGSLCCALLAAATGCERGSAGSTAPKGDASQASEASETAREEGDRWAALVAGKDEDGDLVMEAREYLAPGQDKNGLWKTDREQTLAWVEELYRAGASKVYAVYSPADETIRFNMCASLLAELPAGKEPRAAVLKAFNGIEEQLWGEDSEPAGDDGQKYLFLSMDP